MITETQHLVCLDCDPKFGTEAWVKRHRPDRDQVIHIEVTPYGLSYGVHIVDVVSNICALSPNDAVHVLVDAHKKRESKYPSNTSHIPMLPMESKWGLHSERGASTLYLGREVGWSTMEEYTRLAPCLKTDVVVSYADYGYSASKTRKKGEQDASTLIHQLIDTTPTGSTPDDDLYTRECMYLLGRHMWEMELKRVTGHGFNVRNGVNNLANLPAFQKQQITGIDAMLRQISMPMYQYTNERDRLTRTPGDVLEDAIYGMKAHRLNELLMLSIADQLYEYFTQNGIPLLYSTNGETPWVREASDMSPISGTPSLTAPLRKWTGLMNQFNLVHYMQTGNPLLDANGLNNLVMLEENKLEDAYNLIVSTMQTI